MNDFLCQQIVQGQRLKQTKILQLAVDYIRSGQLHRNPGQEVTHILEWMMKHGTQYVQRIWPLLPPAILWWKKVAKAGIVRKELRSKQQQQQWAEEYAEKKIKEETNFFCLPIRVHLPTSLLVIIGVAKLFPRALLFAIENKNFFPVYKSLDYYVIEIV